MYTYSRCRGLLIHHSIDLFISNHLCHISLLFGDKVFYYKLWFHLNREFYRSILKAYDQNLHSLPQIKEWRGKLIYDCMNAARVIIRRIFKIFIKRLEKKHKLGNIICDLTPLLQEKSMKIEYHGFIIHFKPDWIEYELERAIIIDFKSGYSCNELFMKHKLQILLFAFCFSKYQNVPIDHCEIYYLNYNECEIIEFNNQIMKQVKKKIDLYIKHKYPALISKNKLKSRTFEKSLT